MPLFSEMDGGTRRRVIRGINERINIYRAAARKLRERLLNTPALSQSEMLLIELELVRLRFAVNDQLDLKAAYKLDEKAIAPPSDEKIHEMKDRVVAIEAVNAQDKTAKQIIKLATDIAGGLHNATLT